MTNTEDIKVIAEADGIEVSVVLNWPSSAPDESIKDALSSATDAILRRVNETRRLQQYPTNELVQELARRDAVTHTKTDA